MKIDTWLPSFPGFYNTHLEFDEERAALDFTGGSGMKTDEDLLRLGVSQITKNVEEIKQSDAENKDEQIQQIWDNVQAKVDFEEAVRDSVDYEKYHLDVSEAASDHIESELKGLNLITSITFEGVSSPKQYNYGTNVIIDVSDENKKNIIQYIGDHESAFEKYAEEHFSSRDGFISFMENNLESWTEEYLFGDEADRAVSAFLEFVLENEDINYDYVDEDIYKNEYIDDEKMAKEIEKALSLTESLTFKKFLKIEKK